jgi:hypothetical protein
MCLPANDLVDGMGIALPGSKDKGGPERGQGSFKFRVFSF